MMRPIDIPTHLLYLITEHSILLFAVAIFLPAVIGKRLRAGWKRFLARRYFAVIL